MASIPRISDGQPVTYEFLNLLVDAVNQLSNPETGGANQDIEVTGSSYSLNKNDPVAIVVGRFTLEFGALTGRGGSVRAKTIQFDGQFKNTPLVFLSAVDDTADEANTTSYISVVATKVSKTSFTCRGRRTYAGKKAMQEDNITVNFVAIGTAAGAD